MIRRLLVPAFAAALAMILAQGPQAAQEARAASPGQPLAAGEPTLADLVADFCARSEKAHLPSFTYKPGTLNRFNPAFGETIVFPSDQMPGNPPISRMVKVRILGEGYAGTVSEVVVYYADPDIPPKHMAWKEALMAARGPSSRFDPIHNAKLERNGAENVHRVLRDGVRSGATPHVAPIHFIVSVRDGPGLLGQGYLMDLGNADVDAMFRPGGELSLWRSGSMLITDPVEAAGRIRDQGRALRDVVLGLAEYNRAGLVHHDLKTSNLTILGGTKNTPAEVATGSARYCLADPSLSEDIGEARNAAKKFGTPGYAPPEIGTGRPAAPSMDLYSVGVMFTEAMAGDFPPVLPDQFDFDRAAFQAKAGSHLAEANGQLRKNGVNETDLGWNGRMAQLVTVLLEPDPNLREAKLRTLPQGIVQLSPDGKVVGLDPAFLAWLAPAPVEAPAEVPGGTP